MNIPSSEGATPVMAQWFALKKEQPDALLFFRMGDFFELFFKDAEAAAHALDISLTARGNHGGEPIPMCGVPVGTASTYLARLITKGFRVAVAEQTEDPNKRAKGQKGPLSRAIVRLITPGTLTEDELLDATQSNYILCIIPHNDHLGIAWIDISTGSFETTQIQEKQLQDLLGRINPSEILITPDLPLYDYENKTTTLNDLHSLNTAKKELLSLFQINSLDALGDFCAEEIIACYELVHYIQKTQNGLLPQLSRPQSQQYNAVLTIDPATRSSLEILQNHKGKKEFTLFSSVNKTITPPGARMLANWLSSPLTTIKYIEKRQGGWKFLQENVSILNELRNILKGTPDIARALGRLSLGRGQPKDLSAIKHGLQTAQQIATLLQSYDKKNFPSILQQLYTYLNHGQTLLQKLTEALEDNLPLKLEDGGIIQKGYDETLDSYRNLHEHSRQIIIALQQKYCEQYNINTLKIRHHNQLGYIIEISTNAANKLRDKSELILRQGTANLARFTTVELSELGEKIHKANISILEQEKALFQTLVTETLNERNLPILASAMAMIDVLQSCATLFIPQQWCIPLLTDDTQFQLTNCRHPVVESALSQKENFSPNSCNLSNQNRVMLLTGPNMAGKSTFLRQIALCVILAQSGLPVPATDATIGIVDRLFSRVGASDDLAHGRSTFMVEMTEAAAILNQAGPKSLVVIDEIGRGTSTSDGLAIAWAILESLHHIIQCRTIFATHFHELVESTQYLSSLKPFTMKVQEWKGKIIFQYEVVPGAAEHSWGLHVAQLAGVTTTTLKRAQQILNKIEQQQNQTQPQLPLLDTNNFNNTYHEDKKDMAKIQDILKKVNPDAITPKKALDILYKLKETINKL